MLACSEHRIAPWNRGQIWRLELLIRYRSHRKVLWPVGGVGRPRGGARGSSPRGRGSAWRGLARRTQGHEPEVFLASLR
jgi:hypothetical protein